MDLMKNQWCMEVSKVKTRRILSKKCAIVFQKADLEKLDTKYQDITYFKQNGNEIVDSDDFIHIDFLNAMSEMENLYWNLFNHIGFRNHKTNDFVQFIRQGPNKWYVDVPINDGKNWEGYCWSAYGDNKTISNMLRLYFEEVKWFGMLSWKMRRFQH